MEVMKLHQKATNATMAGLILGLHTLAVASFFICLFVLLWAAPLAFRVPALITSALTLLTKLIALIVHTPAMKKLSLKMSQLESNFESSLQVLLLSHLLLLPFFEFLLQVLLLLHIWLSGGELHILTITSSLLVIGKVPKSCLISTPPSSTTFSPSSSSS